MANYKKNRDIFAPINIFTFLSVINIIIPVLAYVVDKNSKAINRSYLVNAINDEESFCVYVLLWVVSYYLVILGSKIRLIIPRDNKKGIESSEKTDTQFTVIFGVFFWLIGCVAFFMIMRQVGGVYYFFSNSQYRTSMARDIDVWSWLLPFANYGTLLIIYSLKGSKKKLNWLHVLLILVSGLMSGLGGRKALLILAIESIIVYHYTVAIKRCLILLKIRWIIQFLFMQQLKNQMS